MPWVVCRNNALRITLHVPRPTLKEVIGISFTELRINRQIRAKEVRVIDSNGASLGVFPLDEAVKMADDRDTDLVEMSPNAKPPVCKLLDYGKYKYEQTKKDKVAKKKQHTVVTKEIQVRPNIDPHDLKIKLDHAAEFFDKSYKVKFVIRFRGRELEYKEKIGPEMIQKIVTYLSEKADVETEPQKEERVIIFVMAPKKKK